MKTITKTVLSLMALMMLTGECFPGPGVRGKTKRRKT